MNVKRITTEGLEKILHNKVLTPVTCVVKFYSNQCHLCHALQKYYIDIADEYALDRNIVFYAYNMDDDPSIQKMLKFEGVPTIAVVNPNPGRSQKKLSNFKILEEPESPHEKTWYRVRDIKNLIEEEKI